MNMKPDSTWDLERLTGYVRHETDLSKRRERQAEKFGKSAVLHSYRAGYGLSLVRDKLKEEKQYVAWLKESGIGRTRAWGDLLIYEEAGSEDNLRGMSSRNEAPKHFIPLARLKAKAEENHDARDLLPLSDYRLECCSVAELGPRLGLEPASLDLAFADAPWDKASQPILTDIGAFARTYLKPGRLLLCYSGVLNVPANIKRLEAEGLDYVSIFGIIYPDMLKQAKLISRRLRNGWRPILVFSNGPYDARFWVDDSLDGMGREKAHDPMQTNVEELMYWLHRLTVRGEKVASLCGGGFSEGVACRSLERRFVGCDPVAEKVEAGKLRIAAVEGPWTETIYTRWRG